MSTKYWTESEVADRLRVATATVARWRKEGTGPAYTKIGGTLRYSEQDVSDWLDANTHKNWNEDDDASID